jgi:hypothetical protein
VIEEFPVSEESRNRSEKVRSRSEEVRSSSMPTRRLLWRLLPFPYQVWEGGGAIKEVADQKMERRMRKRERTKTERRTTTPSLQIDQHRKRTGEERRLTIATVADGCFHDTSGFLDSFHSDLELVDIVKRIKYPEYVHSTLLGLFAEMENRIVG